MACVSIKFRDGREMNRIFFEDGTWEKRVGKPENWGKFKRKSYQVKLQKAMSDRVYNVPGTPGVVYNFLEDCRETVADAGYIVTGLLGEMWPIGRESLAGYDAEEKDISEEPKSFWTKSGERVYFAIQIPLEVKFSVETSYGLLKGNYATDEIPHGKGDYLVCNSFAEGDYRVINGAIFHEMYENEA